MFLDQNYCYTKKCYQPTPEDYSSDTEDTKKHRSTDSPRSTAASTSSTTLTTSNTTSTHIQTLSYRNKQQTISDRSCLFYAIYKQHYEIVDFLVQNLVGINIIPAHDGITPLHVACATGNKLLVQLLREENNPKIPLEVREKVPLTIGMIDSNNTKIGSPIEVARKCSFNGLAEVQTIPITTTSTKATRKSNQY